MQGCSRLPWAIYWTKSLKRKHGQISRLWLKPVSCLSGNLSSPPLDLNRNIIEKKQSNHVVPHPSVIRALPFFIVSAVHHCFSLWTIYMINPSELAGLEIFLLASNLSRNANFFNIYFCFLFISNSKLELCIHSFIANLHISEMPVFRIFFLNLGLFYSQISAILFLAFFE